MPYIHLNPSGYKTSSDMNNLLNYVLNGEKNILTGGNIPFQSPSDIYDEMIRVKNTYHKTTGRQLRHLVFSPSDNENTSFSDETLYMIATRICMLFQGYQTVFSIHRDTGRSHIHIIINTVSFINGKKIDINLYQLKSKIEKIVGCFISINELKPKSYYVPTRTVTSIDDL